MSVATPPFLNYETRAMKHRNELFMNRMIPFLPNCTIWLLCILFKENCLHAAGMKLSVCQNGQGLRPRQIFRKYL